QQKIWEVKSNRYKLLKGYFPGQDDNLHIEGASKDNITLHACELTENAYAVGKTLEEITVEKMPIEIASFTRHGYKSNRPAPHTKLEIGDILVLTGTPDEIYLMEEKLLQ